MSNSHRKKRRGRTKPHADEPRQPEVQVPVRPAEADIAAPEQTSAPRSLPPIEVPVIGPPAGKPGRKPGRKPARKPLRDEQPALPPGALVSLTISGGFAFSQRMLAVYDDGRATYAQLGGGHSQSQRAFHLSDEQMQSVRDELARLDTAAFTGRTVSPDAYAYEIAARVGEKVVSGTVSTGFIPPELAPLLRVLRDLMPAV